MGSIQQIEIQLDISKDLPKNKKTPWPTKAVMQQIYDQHLWGGSSYDFYSGEGSHKPEIFKPYIDAVIEFFKCFNGQLTVCDLGCGDFNVGQHLIKYCQSYIAVDIVDKLIKRNKSLFKHPHLEFQCLDIVEDPLPKSDCAILRQFLQHLSNDEIKQISKKLKDYKHLIVTEHLPLGDFVANRDMVKSMGNRTKYHSGMDLLQTPFNLEVKEARVLNEVILCNGKGRISTILLIL